MFEHAVSFTLDNIYNTEAQAVADMCSPRQQQVCHKAGTGGIKQKTKDLHSIHACLEAIECRRGSGSSNLAGTGGVKRKNKSSTLHPCLFGRDRVPQGVNALYRSLM